VRTAVATAYVTSLLMAALDTHVVNIMLPTLSRDFHASLGSVKWTVIGYVVSLAMAMPLAAWLSGRFGERRVFLVALGAFIAASAGCGAAQNLPELVGVRFLQGAAGGLLGPVATAMLYHTYPQHERARMTRLLLMPIAMGPALAPPLGGLLVTHLSWRYAFFLNAPVGLVAITMVLLGLPADKPTERQRLNVPDFAAAALALSGALYVIGEGPELGWTSPPILLVALLTAVAVAIFVAIEFRVPNPVIDLRLLRDPLFRHSNLATVFQTMAFLGGMLYITPLMLQELGGRSSLTAGLVLAVVPIGVVTSSQTVGRAFDLIGPRPLVVTGQFLLAIDLFAVSRFGASTPLWVFCVAMFLAGLSNGMGMVGLQASMFAHIPTESISKAATALNVNRQLATALGVGIATALLASGKSPALTSSGPYHVAYLVTAACSLGAAVVGLRLPRRVGGTERAAAAELAEASIADTSIAAT
jgi:EmrB/QacA subfamily drug resistance transporter